MCGGGCGQPLGQQLRCNIGLVERQVVPGAFDDGEAGARYMNYGDFDVMFDAEALFTEASVITAIREHRTLSLHWALRNGDDGGIAIDVPGFTAKGGVRTIPRNETVKVTFQGTAHRTEQFDHVVGITLFPYLPKER